MATAARDYLTPDEYLAFERRSEERHEYYDGEIVAMSGGSPRHSQIAGTIIIAFGMPLRDRPCSVHPSDLKVGRANRRAYMYPDVTVVCGEPIYGEPERDVLLNPLLVVEVLSPSTERFDRTRKFIDYQSIPTLVAYLLVAQDTPLIELCTRQDGGSWTWSDAEGLDATLAIPALDITLPLAEVYRRVNFAAAGDLR